jgi:peroxiredoxin
LKDTFKCKGCGAPRQYITQFCPECYSTGPHDPIDNKTTRTQPSKHKATRDDPWFSNIQPEEKPVVKKRKDTREKEITHYPFKERQRTRETDDDREMRSLWATEKKNKPKHISKKTWEHIAIAGVAVIAVIVIALHFGSITQQLSNAFNRVSAWIAYQPPAVTSAVSTNATEKKPGTISTPVQNNTQTPSNNSTVTTPVQSNTQTPSNNSTVTTPVKNPEPARDTTKPVLVGTPLREASDSAVTIIWNTDEKASSQVRYGTDTSYPFPSSEINKMELSHSIFINGLTPDTTYHFQIISIDGAGNKLESGDYTFRTESITDESPYIGSRAPNFTLSTLDGKTVSLSDFRGKKVILNFWASWCSPCKVELPHLQATWDKHKESGDIMFLSVAGSQSDEDIIRSYVQDNNYNFTVCLDPGDSVFNKYSINSIPMTYFLDKSGVIRRVQQGMFTSPGEVEFNLNSY